MLSIILRLAANESDAEEVTTEFDIEHAPQGVFAVGLGVGESVEIRFLSDASDVYTPFIEGGNPVVLDEDNNSYTFRDPGVYQLAINGNAGAVRIGLR